MLSKGRIPIKKGVERANRESIAAAIDWIMLANSVTAGQGISKGFDLLRRSWSPFYPETTGYTIPSLLNASEFLARPELKNIAFHLAIFLAKCVTSEGGVKHWKAGETGSPIVFDTGQVIFGWLAAYEAGASENLLIAAQKAGDWLVSIQDDSGAWLKNQHLNVPKVIDARVSWSLLRLYQHIPNIHYLLAAQKNLNWVLLQQEEDGWFKNASFQIGKKPFTHAIAYTIEGLIESSILVNSDSYLNSGKRAADAILFKMKADGFISGKFDRGWKAKSRTCCLTGNCQLARVWLRLFDLKHDQMHYDAAIKAIEFVKRTQQNNLPFSSIKGAIAGSFPIYGSYERFKYPNWASKFFIDALLTIENHRNGSINELTFKG